MQLELPFVTHFSQSVSYFTVPPRAHPSRTHFTARHSAQRDDRHGADRTATGVSRRPPGGSGFGRGSRLRSAHTLHTKHYNSK